MRRYEQIVSAFGYRECRKECHDQKAISSSSEIGLMRNCSYCHECIDNEKVKDDKAIHWAPIIVITVAGICFILCRWFMKIADFWEWIIWFLLKIPLFLAVANIPLVNELFHLCTLKKICLIFDMSLVLLAALKHLKFDHLPINNSKFNKRVKIRILPDLLIIVISIVFLGSTLYYTRGMNYLKASEAYQCEIKSISVIIFVYTVMTLPLYSVLAFCSSDSTQTCSEICVLFLYLASNCLLFLPVFWEEFRLDPDPNVLSMVLELSGVTMSVIIKHWFPPAGREEQSPQTSGDTSIQLDRRRCWRLCFMVIYQSARRYATANWVTSRLMRDERHLEMRRTGWISSNRRAEQNLGATNL